MRITMTMGDRHGVAIMLTYGTDPTTTPGALIRRPNCQNLSPIPAAQLGWRARGDGGSLRGVCCVARSRGRRDFNPGG
jgi:hypothetical protein